MTRNRYEQMPKKGSSHMGGSTNGSFTLVDNAKFFMSHENWPKLSVHIVRYMSGLGLFLILDMILTTGLSYKWATITVGIISIAFYSIELALYMIGKLVKNIPGHPFYMTVLYEVIFVYFLDNQQLIKTTVIGGIVAIFFASFSIAASLNSSQPQTWED